MTIRGTLLDKQESLGRTFSVDCVKKLLWVVRDTHLDELFYPSIQVPSQLSSLMIRSWDATRSPRDVLIKYKEDTIWTDFKPYKSLMLRLLPQFISSNRIWRNTMQVSRYTMRPNNAWRRHRYLLTIWQHAFTIWSLQWWHLIQNLRALIIEDNLWWHIR